MTATATAPKAPFLSWGFTENEETDSEFEWECLCDSLTELMEKINPKGQWHCNVHNAGWMARNGYKNFKTTKGLELLQAILPKADCHFRIFVEGKGFGRYIKIQNFHHDSPTGNEWYEVVRFNGRIHPAS